MGTRPPEDQLKAALGRPRSGCRTPETPDGNGASPRGRLPEAEALRVVRRPAVGGDEGLASGYPHP
ncbi:hypothetical protein ABZ454_20275 [Streptomyces sp. NPDC005803]|uniref:hypothetical protein n=1 Tax=Streptomyces sp. NPDC005803 TaxID=3154297 RepID=UPI0033CBB795